jgi:hypothetical protein
MGREASRLPPFAAVEVNYRLSRTRATSNGVNWRGKEVDKEDEGLGDSEGSEEEDRKQDSEVVSQEKKSADKGPKAENSDFFCCHRRLPGQSDARPRLALQFCRP